MNRREGGETGFLERKNKRERDQGKDMGEKTRVGERTGGAPGGRRVEFSLEEITDGREIRGGVLFRGNNRREREIGERRGKPEGERSGRGHREEGAEKNQRDGMREEGGGEAWCRLSGQWGGGVE